MIVSHERPFAFDQRRRLHMNPESISAEIMKIFDTLSDADQKNLLIFTQQIAEEHDPVLSA